MKISACIIAFNEEKNIAQAIASVSWADEIIIIDSESTDKTTEIAKSLGANVVTKKWEGFSKQKQFAADIAANNWIFSLDADERLSEKLKGEILELKTRVENVPVDGFRIPRLSFYMKCAVRHSGWYPDWQIRLFNREKGKWKDVLIHESIVMSEFAKVEKLGGDILHYSVENAAHHHRMIGERYAPLAAEQMFRRGKRTSFLKIHTASFIAFFQTYILKGGFLDGLPGFCIARFAAHHAFLKHLLLWELQQENSKIKVKNLER